MSAATRSIANSFVSRLPQVNRLKIRMIMESIFKNRQAITEALNQSKHGLRNVISSSEILKVLKQANIFVDIVNVKQLLQELGFSFNGPACSFLDLFAKIKATLQGLEQNGLEVDSRQASHVSAYSGQPPVGLKANL
jgi:aspartate-semialdehyde dehydrogenase